MRKILGREPALLVAQVVSALIAVVVLAPLAENITAAIVAVITAAGGLVVAALVVRDGQLAALVGLARSGISLIVVLGVDWAPAYQVLVLVAIEQVAAIFMVRDRVEALLDAEGNYRATAPVVEAV